MRDIVICLVGESGCGKTTEARELHYAGYNVIESYTTREIRGDDEWGHIFATENDWRNTDPEEVIAYTHYCGHHYWATKSQYQGQGITIYVIDPVGVENLKRLVKDALILVIYLKSDSDVRYKRMCESRSDVVAGMRLAKDREAFASLECDFVVDANSSVEDTHELVLRIIHDKLQL